MAEVGVDITRQRSKRVDEALNQRWDWVITVFDHAHESCPIFPRKTKILHVGFEDPPRLAENAESEEAAMGRYRRVRDEIRAFVETLPDKLTRLA